MASTINQASFHLGAAAGAWMSALALYFGVRYNHLPWVGEVLTLIALAIAIVAVSMEHSHRKSVFARHPEVPNARARA